MTGGSPFLARDGLTESRPQHYKTKFTGSGGEYFRIWIVNMFLTILTLGIYAAWAKVRTRQYFYAHTMLAGQSFDYTANPFALLRGNLIIGGGLFLYFFAEVYNPVYSGLVVAAFYFILPFLIYKSLRFFAHNSAFRNVRFHFLGSLRESYKTYFLLPLLFPLTLGLIVPYWVFRRKKYFFDNFSFGTTTNSFQGRPRSFYKVYAFGSLMFFLAAVLAGMGLYITFPIIKSASTSDPGSVSRAATVMIPLFMYLFFLVFFTFAQQYIYARLTNYCWGQTSLGNVRFQSTLQVRRLLWIKLTNILAILLSLGLLIPWAKVRRARYIFDNLTVITAESLDDFTARVEPEVSAFGEAATDFFDIEIGL